MLDQILPIVFDAVNSIVEVVIVFLCVTYVRPWLKKLMEDWVVKRAVRAAEKIYRESGAGEKKKQYVVQMLVSVGAFKLDENGNIPKYWDMLIEAAVKALDLADKQLQLIIDEDEEEDGE